MSKSNAYTKAADEILKELTLAEKAALVSGADAWHTEPVERLGVRGVMMTDGPHGLRKEIEDGSYVMQQSETATCFPTAAALACSYDRQLLYSVGHAIADEAKLAGVSAVLGPGMNIKRDPRCGRNFEYFSEDPLLTGELAAAYVEGMQENGVAACVKHFCLNSQETARFVQDSCVDMRTIRQLYTAAFERAVKLAKPEMLMTSYNKVNGKYTEANPHYLDRLLRTEWGFDGMVVTDWTATTDRPAEIRAGCDLEMPGKCSGNTEIILDAVKNGTLKEWELDNCVRRVLAFAIKHSAAVKQPCADILKINREKARTAAAAACVLLKNESRVLPLDLNKKTGVVGLMAKKPRWQGAGSSKVCAPVLDTLMGEFERRGVRCEYADGYTEKGETNETLLSQAAALAAECDVVVAVIGLPECCESEGFDRPDMRLPQGMLKLMAQLCANCENVVAVLQLGSPVELPFRDSVKGIVCAYLGGQAGGSGLADVLTGRVNPSGRLAETWPAHYEDVPTAASYAKSGKIVEYREGVYSGYRYFDAVDVKPAFAFGAGLTYSSFMLEKPAITPQSIAENGSASLTVSVKNISPVAGTETLLVFAAPSGSPCKRLVGFEKLPLMPSEQKAVTITLEARDFMDFDTLEGRFVLQSGEWDITVSGTDKTAACKLTARGTEKPLPDYITPCLGMDTPNSVFYSVLGYIPAEPPVKPYNMNSTVAELQKTLAGKVLHAAVMSNMGAGMEAADEESKAMVVKSMAATPLRSLNAFSKGKLPRSTCMGLLALANGKPLEAAKFFAEKPKK